MAQTETLKFIVFVSKLSGGYEAIFVLILFGKDIRHHVLVQCVVGRVAMTLKLFPQVFFHLVDEVRVRHTERVEIYKLISCFILSIKNV